MSPQEIVERIMTQHWDMAACSCWVCRDGREAGCRPRAEYLLWRGKLLDSADTLKADWDRLQRELDEARALILRRAMDHQESTAALRERVENAEANTQARFCDYCGRSKWTLAFDAARKEGK